MNNCACGARWSAAGAFVDQTLTPSGTSWTFTESSLLPAGSYTYQAQVFDAAGNTGSFSSTRAVTIDLSALPLPGAAATLATINGVAPTGGSVPLSNNNTPALAGTMARALNAGEVVRVYRNGTGVANANVSGTSWNYTNTALADGSYTFFARVELGSNSAIFGASSSTVSASIDATAPTQVASISGIFDDASISVGGNNTTDTTPLINGTLNAGLAVGESVEVVRTGGAGSVTRTATVTGGTNWSLQEASAISAAAYTYTVRVLDAAGNRGANRSLGVTVIAALPSVNAIAVAYSAGLALATRRRHRGGQWRRDGRHHAHRARQLVRQPARGRLGCHLPRRHHGQHRHGYHHAQQLEFCRRQHRARLAHLHRACGKRHRLWQHQQQLHGDGRHGGTGANFLAHHGHQFGHAQHQRDRSQSHRQHHQQRWHQQ